MLHFSSRLCVTDFNADKKMHAYPFSCHALITRFLFQECKDERGMVRQPGERWNFYSTSFRREVPCINCTCEVGTIGIGSNGRYNGRYIGTMVGTNGS